MCFDTHGIFISKIPDQRWGQTVRQGQAKHDESHVASRETKLDQTKTVHMKLFLFTVQGLSEQKGNYRLDSKQGQRGIQEAQTCTKSENHVADQDYFHFGEKSKERILRGIGIWAEQKHKI